MKKLLFVGPYPPPFGGIASHLYGLLPNLVRNGYEVVSLSSASIDEIKETSGIRIIKWHSKRFFIKNIISYFSTLLYSLKLKIDMNLWEFFKLVNQANAIIQIIRTEKVEIVLLYDYYAISTTPLLNNYFNHSIVLISFIFGEFYLNPTKYKAIPKYVKSIFTDSDIILSSSHYCADSISKVLGYEFPVEVVYVGVDHELYAPSQAGQEIRAASNIPPSAITLLFLGRMNVDMGLDFLLRVAPRLLKAHPEVYLIIAGAEGDLSAPAKELADKYPRVTYCPNLPFSAKPNYYAACDVFLAPTKEKHACMGVSIKEAMACAKPVIASTSGGIPEAIEHGVNGYLVPFRDGSLDEGIFIKCVGNLVKDAELRRRMGENGRIKAVKLFSNEITTRHYLDILENITYR
jgi:glycosyltransferase involved in cell wall biosynthesis